MPRAVKPREGLGVREGAQGMSSMGSAQVRGLQLLPPATSLIMSVCPHKEFRRQSGPVLLSCILRWLLATPNCCHRPRSALGTTPIQHPGSSSSSADSVMCKHGLETVNGTTREELWWENMGKSGSHERGCMGLTTITKSMEEQNTTPLHGHFHTMHNLTRVISKARVEGEVT